MGNFLGWVREMRQKEKEENARGMREERTGRREEGGRKGVR